jgi:tRNA threonylcarbamoyladenosine biosynthesis protein TsaE
MTLTFKIDTVEQTKGLAELIADNIERGSIILLRGDLGAGKTTFSQFLGKKLGVKRHMTSPTFNIIKSYPLNGYFLHHMDCYRLEDSLEDLGFEEYFNDNDLSLVEWPDYISEFLPEQYIEITITLNNEERQFSIEDHGNFNNLMEALHDFSID